MSVKSTILLITLVLNTFLGFSQRIKSTNENNLKSEFQLFFDKADAYFKAGDYFRAKNVYDYCSKMTHPRAKDALKKKDISVSLWIEKATALRKYNNGETLEAQKILERIVQLNPYDKVSNNLLADTNIRLTIERVSANNLKNSTSEKLLPSNSNPGIIKIDKQGTLQKAAIQKRDINTVAEEYAEEQRKKKLLEQKKYKEFVDYYTKGVQGLNACNYKASFKYFEKAHKLYPKAVKTKRFYNIFELLENQRNRLDELLINPKNNLDLISSTYEQIIRINRDIELIQVGSSCKGVSLEYANFLKRQLPLKADKYNCGQITKITNKIREVSEAGYNEKIVQDLIKACENNPCDNVLYALNQRLASVNGIIYNGNNNQAKTALDGLFVEIMKSQGSCEDIDYSLVLEKAEKLKNKIDLAIKNAECNENQKKNFELAIQLFDNKQYEKSLIQLEKIDTSCVDVFFKNTLKRQEKSIAFAIMKVYEDSAKIAIVKKEFVNAKSIYNMALTYSRSKADSLRVIKEFNLADCLSKNKNSNKCYGISISKCDTVSFNSIRLNFGLIGKSLNNEIFRPSLFIGSQSNKATATSQYFIGLTYLKSNYAKAIDHGVTLNYFSEQTFEFIIPNQSSLYSFQNSSVGIGYEQKYHKKGVCLDKLRMYGKLGFLVNYNIISDKNSISSSIYKQIQTNFAKSIGTTFVPGFGFEVPNKNVSLEFFLFRSAVLKSTNGEIQYPWNSNFVNGGLGIKFNYGFKL
jgi:tetratricopeptide (TPR) repeat protein